MEAVETYRGFEIVEVYVTREDGETAKVLVPDVDEDLWTCIGRAYPTAYDVIDEGMLLRDGVEHRWDVRFGPGEDEELAAWL